MPQAARSKAPWLTLPHALPARLPAGNAELLLERADVLMQRGWEGDVMLALRDCDQAIAVGPRECGAHFKRLQVRRITCCWGGGGLEASAACGQAWYWCGCHCVHHVSMCPCVHVSYCTLLPPCHASSFHTSRPHTCYMQHLLHPAATTLPPTSHPSTPPADLPGPGAAADGSGRLRALRPPVPPAGTAAALSAAAPSGGQAAGGQAREAGQAGPAGQADEGEAGSGGGAAQPPASRGSGGS